MKYTLLAYSDESKLNKKVNDLLRDGWQLYGNPAVSSSTFNNRDAEDQVYTQYCQALINENENGFENSLFNENEFEDTPF